MTSQVQYNNTANPEIQQVGMETDSNRTVRYQNLRQLLPVSNSPILIKCRCGYDVRRVTVHTVPTYDELSFLVLRLFRSSLSNNLGNLIIKYIDEDYDLVSITDDLDINHAVALSSTLKVVIFDRETIPYNSEMNKDSSSLPSILSRPYLGMNSLDLRLELAQLIDRVDLLLKTIGKDSEAQPTEETKQKNNQQLSSADLEEFAKPNKQLFSSDLSEHSTTLTIGTSELSTLKNEMKPSSIYTSSIGQNQSNDSSYPPLASRPPVPLVTQGAGNYQNHQTNIYPYNSSNQQNGYPPTSNSYPASQQPVIHQPNHMYPNPQNPQNHQLNQYNNNVSQTHSQRPPNVNSQPYVQSPYQTRPVSNAGYPNSNTSYPYPNGYPSVPGGPYQQQIHYNQL